MYRLRKPIVGIKMGAGSSTSGSLETATKRSIVHNAETRDRAFAARLEYTNGRLLKNMKTTRGRVIAASARSGGQALKQESVPHLGSSDVAVVRTRG